MRWIAIVDELNALDRIGIISQNIDDHQHCVQHGRLTRAPAEGCASSVFGPDMLGHLHLADEYLEGRSGWVPRTEPRRGEEADGADGGRGGGTPASPPKAEGYAGGGSKQEQRSMSHHQSCLRCHLVCTTHVQGRRVGPAMLAQAIPKQGEHFAPSSTPLLGPSHRSPRSGSCLCGVRRWTRD